MIESKLIPRFRSLWCHQRPGKLTTPLGIRPRVVVSFPGRWWHHNDLNLGINSYNSSLIVIWYCILYACCTLDNKHILNWIELNNWNYPAVIPIKHFLVVMQWMIVMPHLLLEIIMRCNLWLNSSIRCSLLSSWQAHDVNSGPMSVPSVSWRHSDVA